MPTFYYDPDIDFHTVIQRGIALAITVIDSDLVSGEEFEAVVFDRGSGALIKNMLVTPSPVAATVAFTLTAEQTTALTQNPNAEYNIRNKKPGADWGAYMWGKIPIYDYGGVT